MKTTTLILSFFSMSTLLLSCDKVPLDNSLPPIVQTIKLRFVDQQGDDRVSKVAYHYSWQEERNVVSPNVHQMPPAETSDNVSITTSRLGIEGEYILFLTALWDYGDVYYTPGATTFSLTCNDLFGDSEPHKIASFWGKNSGVNPTDNICTGIEVDGKSFSVTKDPDNNAWIATVVLD